MTIQKITKWDNSLGIRLPQTLLQQMGWQEGETLTITAQNHQIILSPTKPHYILSELLKNARPEDQHQEIEWGEAQGAENW